MCLLWVKGDIQMKIREPVLILLKKSRLIGAQTRKMSINIGGMRKPYHNQENTFDKSDLVSKDPIEQFRAWFDEATKHDKIEEANAMHIATATPDGIPSGRFVLLKGYGAEGFTFFTNYQGRKARELEANPRAALTFYWEPMKRQVRVEGTVERIGEKESTEYFRSRPLASQIAAVASHQSQVVEDRAVLLDRVDELTRRYSGEGSVGEVPKPDWGGYLVVPHSVEFWQGQSSRMHDRMLFRKEGDGSWVIERLEP